MQGRRVNAAESRITQTKVDFYGESRALSDEATVDGEMLIRNFDNHSCGFGYDVEAHGLLRILLDAIERCQNIIDGRSEQVR